MNQVRQIAVITTSDLHGHEEGMAKAGRLIRRLQEQYPDHILIDNGDVLQGSLLTTFCQERQPNEKLPMHHFLETLSYDCAVVGNHEFNYGKAYAEHYRSFSPCPILSANTIDRSTTLPAFGQGWHRKTLSGSFRIAVLGLTTQYIPHWERKEHIEGLDFIDPVKVAKEQMATVIAQQTADLIVIAYHGGIVGNLEDPDAQSSEENQGRELVQFGAHAVITGHQHRVLAGKIGDTAIVQPGSHGSHVGLIVFDYKFLDGRWVFQGSNCAVLATQEEQPDERIAQLFYPYRQAMQDWLKEPIGSVVGDMRIRDAMEVRLHGHSWLSFLHDVQRSVTFAQLSVVSLFRDTSPGLDATITRESILLNYVFPNRLAMVSLRGADIKAMLEVTASYFEKRDNGDLQAAMIGDQYRLRPFDYDLWEGITYTIDVGQPVGQRVISILFEDKPIDVEAYYTVAMNSYRASGGAHYPFLAEADVLFQSDAMMTDLIIAYCKEHPVIISENRAKMQIW